MANRKVPVLIIITQYPPETGTGVVRVSKFVKFLPEFGYYPVVLTPNTRQGEAEEISDRSAIIRFSMMKYPPTQGRLTPLFPWILYREFLRIKNRFPFETVMMSGGNFYPFFLTPVIAGFHKIPVVLDYRDPWTLNPFTQASTVRGRILQRPLPIIERFCIRFASRVLTVTERMTEEFRETFHLSPNVCRTLENGFDRDDYVAPSDTENSPPEFQRPGVHIVYTGSVYLPNYDFEPIFGALPQLARMLGKPATLHLIGTVDDHHRRLIRSLGIESQIEIWPPVPHHTVPRFMRLGDLLLVSIAVNRSFVGTEYDASNKLYEYLPLGKPIVGIVHPNGTVASVLKRTGAGEVIGSLDPTQIAGAIAKILTHPRPRDRNEVEIDRFDRRTLTRRLSEIFDELRFQERSTEPALPKAARSANGGVNGA